MKKIRLHIVPHAHWDKEWYFTKQESDVLLKNNIDKLIKIFKIDKDFKNFTYDGQYSIIDDYLQYSSNIDYLKQFVSDKKLFIGPWYTQPDLFNSSSESIVRNLLMGIKSSQKLGHSMQVAYVPDSFGQPEQMPQIYNQFDLNNLIYWRGVKKEDLANNVLHYWKGIDGTKIKSINFLMGYWIMGAHFPYTTLTINNLEQQAKLFLKSFNSDLEIIKKFNIELTNDILIPMGGDQAPIVELLPLFFKQLNKLDQNHEWIWSSYEQYCKSIENIKIKNTISGELKWSQSTRIHKSIGSQRYDIKSLLKQTDILLFDQLEPLVVYCDYLGIKYDSQLIQNALKKLLVSNAHDSLGGCNSDLTNKDVYHRIVQANQELNSLKIKLLRILSKNIDKNNILLFNPYPKKVSKNFYMTLFTKEKNFNLFLENNKVNFINIDQACINDDVDLNIGTFGESQEAKNGYYKTKILIPNFKFESIGFKKIFIKETIKSNKKQNNDLENNWWKVQIQNNKLNILNKKYNKEFKDIFNLQAYYDAGDSYDFSPKTLENKVISKLKTLNYQIKQDIETLIIKLNLVYLVEEKQDQEIEINLYLFNNNQIDLKLNLNNKNNNIKWVLNAPVGFKNEFSYVSQVYSEVKRKVQLDENKIWKQQNWAEKPHPIETNENFVYLKNDKNKIGFITLGNNEYEIIGNNYSTLSLTLFRSVDSLGKNNLLWRPGRASGTGDYLIKTVDAELKKQLNFDITFFYTWYKWKYMK